MSVNDFSNALAKAYGVSIDSSILQAIQSKELKYSLGKLAYEIVAQELGPQLREIVQKSMTKEILMEAIGKAVGDYVESILPYKEEY